MIDVKKVTFQDAMDPTRFLRIKEEKNDTVLCKVFFDHTKQPRRKKERKLDINDDRNQPPMKQVSAPRRGERLVFAGEVELPKRLFFVEGRTTIGFNVMGSESSSPSRGPRSSR